MVPFSYGFRIADVSDVDSIQPRLEFARSLNGNVLTSVRPLHATWIFLQKKGKAGSQSTATACARNDVAVRENSPAAAKPAETASAEAKTK
jgi:hypothetical protein